MTTSPHVFLINLDRHADRLGHMAEAIGNLGLRFERMPAVDGSMLGPAELHRRVPGPGTFRLLSPAEIGCFLSHRACWQRILDAGLQAAVILEDDVHFGSDAGTVLAELDWVPAGADIVRLETWLSHSVVDRRPMAEVSQRSVHRLRSVQYGTAGYIITRSGAEKALRLTESFVDTTDDFLFNPETPHASAFVSYQMLPAICVQDHRLNRGNAAFGSSIQMGSKAPRPEGLWLYWREVRRALRKGLRPLKHALLNVAGPRRWTFVSFG